VMESARLEEAKNPAASSSASKRYTIGAPRVTRRR
jgi:hypothetical protein